jgi:Flp pilus assembly protein TadG
MLRRRPSLRRLLRSAFVRDRSGAAAVEFAFVGLPLFALIFALIESAGISAVGVLLNTAADDVARQVLTGQIQKADIDEASFRRRLCDEVDFVLSCDKLKIDLRTFPTYKAIPVNAPMQLRQIDDTNFCFDPGTASSITVLRVFYEWPWSTAYLANLAKDTDGNSIIFAISAFMNEPFGDLASTKSTC